MIKTSESHPLRIDAVEAPGGGLIGMTFCPGKKQRGAASGTWDRDVDLDLTAIVEWGAAALVSAIEQHELDALRVQDLGERAERHGLDWHHLSVVDAGTPEATFEAGWPYASCRLRRLIEDGKRIVVHCKGGLGRTGTIAARLLVELGIRSEDAVRMVRAARPGAIETSGQLEYVHRCGMPRRGENSDRFFGCLLGGAIGDAFGYEVEFDKLPTIRRRFGPDGIREPVRHNGRLLVSDDTQMTLFTLEGMLLARQDGKLADLGHVTEQIRLAYLDWLETQGNRNPKWKAVGRLHREPSLRHQRAPGTTCLRALNDGGRGTPERPINNSKGCGGVMRVAPLGLARDWSPERAFEAGVRAAALTHGHPSGFLSAGTMAAMVRWLADGTSLHHVAENAVAILQGRTGAGETVAAITAALKLAGDSGARPADAVRALGEGWVGEEALAVGLYACLAGSSFPEVLAIASNHDGDSDSTASIAGQLWGAWRGLADIPHRWVRRLDVHDLIMRSASDWLARAD